MTAPRVKADWEAIEREYRAGQLSVREIARNNGTSDTAIRKRAKKDGWKRDLTQKVRDRVRSEVVRSEVRSCNASDAEIIEEAAERGATIIRSQRRDINQGRAILAQLMTELQAEAFNPDLYDQIIGQHIDEAGLEGQSAYLARKAISLPQRATTLKDLSQSMQRLVALERQAYNLDESAGDADPLSEILGIIDGKTKGL